MHARIMLRDHALSIWQAAVDAVRPRPLVADALQRPDLAASLEHASRLIVFGAGKAGAAMSVAVEQMLSSHLDKMSGFVNIPAGTERPTRIIQLHPARPLGSNHPTDEGVAGSQEILRRVHNAAPGDVALGLLSGGGSALLPAPASGLTLADKQTVTKLLHASGATINEMNAVRKHLSAIKGGRLAEAFRGRALFSLILSDVIGDPLDVIASGPTAADPTTFQDAWKVLEKYALLDHVPAAVGDHLRRGRAGELAETPKRMPAHIHNLVIGNNTRALAAARGVAERLGYRILDLGSMIQGETRDAAIAQAELVRSIKNQREPCAPPVCILSGGETTVTLGAAAGLGGRNQEFVLAALVHLGPKNMRDVVVLSGGTDGEDGPTDAAGALVDLGTWSRLGGLDPAHHLARHDAYPFFDATGDLLRSGPTDTNVMDVRVLLVGRESSGAT